MKKLNFLTVIFSLALAFFSVQGIAKDDSNITDEIRAKLSKNEKLAPFNIDIITQNGVVNLKGVIDSDPNAGTLVELVQETDGVNEVNTSQLKIKNSQHPIDDTLITAKVKGTLLRDKLFTREDIDALGIKVTTKNGTVYLSGKTHDQKQIDNAIAIARAIKGVKNVESSLRVKSMTN